MSDIESKSAKLALRQYINGDDENAARIIDMLHTFGRATKRREWIDAVNTIEALFKNHQIDALKALLNIPTTTTPEGTDQ